MVKELRRKFVLTAMLAVSVILLFLLGAINFLNYKSMDEDTDKTLKILSNYEGDAENLEQKPGLENQNRPPERFGMEGKNDYDAFLSSNFFVVRFDGDGNAIFADTSRTSTVSEEEAKSMAGDAFENGNGIGKSGRYKYMVADSRNVSGKVVVFLDESDEYLACVRVLFLSIGIGLITWILMLLMVILMSKKAIEPVAESIEKQKQFITNAGHELKTPIAIIQSNTEAMELYNGDSKWSRNIKEQTARLTELVKNLLVLSRLDEQIRGNLEEVKISELTENIVNQFRQSFEAKGISVICDIKSALQIQADKRQIEQLISILMDNAVKYTNDKGEVSVRLEKKAKHVFLEVENTCEQLPEVPPQKLFERFYRGDASHNQKSGGYGIGLSMAQSIAEQNKGNLSARYSDNNRICFTARF